MSGMLEPNKRCPETGRRARGSRWLMQFSSMLHDETDRYRRLYLNKGRAKRNVAREHAGILSAVFARDADLACARLLEHTSQTGAAIHALMKQSHKPKR
jgi:GntR family carbon starvation induced transcriptional regulator